MFKTAAGCLGWSPEVIWNTPVPQLILAIEGRYDFAVKTNPFGAPKKPLSPEQESKISMQRGALALARAEARQKNRGKT